MQIVERLRALAGEISAVAKELERPQVADVMQKVSDACNELERAWSRSWIGYQATVYTSNLKPPGPGEAFDSDWGEVVGGSWSEYTHDQIWKVVLEKAGNPSTGLVREAAAKVRAEFKRVREAAVSLLAALDAQTGDKEISSTLGKLRDLRDSLSVEELAYHGAPRGLMSRDSRAMSGGLVVPPHRTIEAEMQSHFSAGEKAKDLESLLQHAANYLDHSSLLKGRIGENDTSDDSSHRQGSKWDAVWKWTSPVFLFYFLALRLPWLALKHPSRLGVKVLGSLLIGAAVGYGVFVGACATVGAFEHGSDPRLNATVLIGSVAAALACSNMVFSMLRELPKG